jgi:hypothetical protein
VTVGVAALICFVLWYGFAYRVTASFDAHVGSLCGGGGIPIVDLSPAWQKKLGDGHSTRLYGTDNDHWMGRGTTEGRVDIYDSWIRSPRYELVTTDGQRFDLQLGNITAACAG